MNDDPGNSALQELNLYVGGTLRLTTTAVDDTWSAGQVGLFRTTNSSTTTLQWDDFACGQDRDVDGTIGTWSSGTFTADTGDWVAAAYNFNDPGGGVTWQKLSLSYDDNGNLTDDGLRKFKYDAWNRLRGATYNGWDPNDPNQWIADYRYYADTRRAKKIVQNRGVETYPNDGGNTTVDLYHDRQGRFAETRNGSNQTTWQYVWGRDGAILCDKNGDVTASNDVNIDVTAGGEGSESPADHRYFFHQDRAGNVVALTDHDADPNNAANGRIAERYTREPAGPLVVLAGVSSSNELGSLRGRSTVGALFGLSGTVPGLGDRDDSDIVPTHCDPATNPNCPGGEPPQSQPGNPPGSQPTPKPNVPQDPPPCPPGYHLDCKTYFCVPNVWPGDGYGYCCGIERDCSSDGCSSPMPNDCMDVACDIHDDCLKAAGITQFPPPGEPPSGYSEAWRDCDCQLICAMHACNPVPWSTAWEVMIQAETLMCQNMVDHGMDCPCCPPKTKTKKWFKF